MTEGHQNENMTHLDATWSPEWRHNTSRWQWDTWANI